MNKAVTSKEEILEVCRQIVAEEGISAVNMRTVANRCKIALGSLYNYFPSKSALLASTIEAVWKDIFHLDQAPQGDPNEYPFAEYLLWLFESVKKSGSKYPKFFSMHALSFASDEKHEGREMMENYLATIKQDLLHFLAIDEKIRPNVFNDRLTPEIFVDYIFTLFLSILLDKKENSEALLELVKNYLYEH